MEASVLARRGRVLETSAWSATPSIAGVTMLPFTTAL
jgi:hypothetical protein